MWLGPLTRKNELLEHRKAVESLSHFTADPRCQNIMTVNNLANIRAYHILNQKRNAHLFLDI